MAKRSDFAQKLLDDLRLRKQRLAASQSTSHSHSRGGNGDAYSYSKPTHRGSTERGMAPSRTGSSHGKSGRSHRLLPSGEASKQMVTFGNSQAPDQMKDLSMALAFAFQNGGKLQRVDSCGGSSVLTFLHQIDKGSAQVGKMEKRSSTNMYLPNGRVPTISQIHIKEISKGAEKLNRILRALSNGLNFDQYSAEIGKELLKGAMDLQESLRMLLNLEEASDYMVSPQQKNRLVLLDDEEDDDNVAKSNAQKQISLPIFSFDKPGKYSRNEPVRTYQKQLPALPYAGDDANIRGRSAGSATSISHRRSVSYSFEIKTPSQFEQKSSSSSSQPKQEKGRISNVIAKLMGLDELPETSDSKKNKETDKSSKKALDRKVPKKTAQASSKNAELKSKDNVNSATPSIKQKVTEHYRTPESQKNSVPPTKRSEVVKYNETPPWKDPESLKLVIGTKNANYDTREHIDQLSQRPGSPKILVGSQRKRDDGLLKEQKETGRDIKGVLYSSDPQQMTLKRQRKSEAGSTKQDKRGLKESKLDVEKRANKISPSNPQKTKSSIGSEQSYALQRPEVPEERRRELQPNQQSSKHKGDPMILKDLPKPVNAGNSQRKHSYMDQPLHKKHITQEAIPLTRSKELSEGKNHQIPDIKKVKSQLKVRTMNSRAMEEKGIKTSAVQESTVMEENYSDMMPRDTNKVIKKQNGAFGETATPLGQDSFSQDVKQTRNSKVTGSGGELLQTRISTGNKTSILRTANGTRLEADSEELNMVPEWLDGTAEDIPSHYPHGAKCQDMKERQSLALDRLGQDKSIPENDNQSIQAVYTKRDGSSRPPKIESSQPNGTPMEMSFSSYPWQMENQNLPTSTAREPLTECQKHLKKILMKSQVFLNTAEALFRLNIPAEILHSSSQDSLENNSKLTLDCGYEIMKRKGKRQELSVHPLMKVSISFTKVKTFDDLVKQLDRSFELLQLYGRNGIPECEAEDYLPRMLETDVYVSDPDLNCMWDIGWNDRVFAIFEKDDVVRDVERQMISGLLDEMTVDLMCVA